MTNTLPVPDDPDTSPAGWRRRFPLPAQVGVAVVLGVGAGLLWPGAKDDLRVLGTAFTNLITMVVVPLMLPLVALSIATMESTRALGRLALKTLIWFEVVTTVILLIGFAIGNLLDVGAGVDLPRSAASSLGDIDKSVSFADLVLQVFPGNIVEAMTQDNLLAVVVFGVLLGVGMQAVGQTSAPLRGVLEALAAVMFKVMGYIVALTPVGVFGLIAYSTAEYGLSTLVDLLDFLLVLYLGFAVVLFGLFPLLARIFGISFWGLFRATLPATLLAFVTRSTEVALVPVLSRLNGYGVSQRTSSFVVPLGYSFNVSGASLYQAIAVLFIAHAYGVPLSFSTQVTILLTLLVLTKGVAAVPSAAIVTLLAAATSLGLPPEGVAILLAVDFFADMPRTSVNLVGDSLASAALDRSEGTFTGPARRPWVRLPWWEHATAQPSVVVGKES